MEIERLLIELAKNMGLNASIKLKTTEDGIQYFEIKGGQQ